MTKWIKTNNRSFVTRITDKIAIAIDLNAGEMRVTNGGKSTYRSEHDLLLSAMQAAVIMYKQYPVEAREFHATDFPLLRIENNGKMIEVLYRDDDEIAVAVTGTDYDELREVGNINNACTLTEGYLAYVLDDDEITIYELGDFQIKITDDIEDGVFLDVSRKGKRIIESWYYEDTRPEQLESTVKDLFFLIDAARENDEDDG